MRRLSTGIAIALLVSGCHKPAPTDSAVIALPAPPQPGQVALYGAPDGISVQSRSGDCVKAACFVFVKDKWRPLAAADSSALPLLTLNGATGGAYSELLWRSSGGGRAVLLNRAAGRDAAKRGQFDGLRIGLKSRGKARYLTVFLAPDAEVALSGGGAWLLAHQKDGSSLLLDLFALQGRTDVTCINGVAIDAAPWAGPVETALSPDVFLSRNVPVEARAAEKARIDQACAAKTKESP
jgi:hypothetical protein